MPALRQVHAHNGVARLQKGKVYCRIGIGAGMCLYVGVFCAEQFFSTFNCKGFYLVHIFAAAVIAVAGVAFRIFVGQHAAHRFHYCGADKVFGSNQFNFIALASEFFTDSRSNFGVTYCKFFQIHLSPSMSFIKLHN